ncbi:hypothetical protein [Luteolibacter sp. AS25]|uniref:hypothetical protein n=1 Tax=Luteolibacter sp. AS25 TaxID=3135776 RepID=UPI00398A854A
MKNIIKISLVAFASISAISCNKEAESTVEVEAATPYPLEVCSVSGEKLGSMGEPVVKNYEGQEVKFCCKSCVPEFEENSAQYLEKIETAAK